MLSLVVLLACVQMVLGGQPRPPYNTGKGFFVAEGKLFDANGVEFTIRGINHLHWDSVVPGIYKTHTNTERWTIDFTRPAQDNIALMQRSISNDVVPIPGNWQGTCKSDPADLYKIVDTWVAQASEWQSLEKYMILNVANEWGPKLSTVWRDSYKTAIQRLRTAGYNCTFMITSGQCGQDDGDLVQYAEDVFKSDPQQNVIFDQHIYGQWSDGGGQSWQIDLQKGITALANISVPVVVGEFGPGKKIGPSPTDITPLRVMQLCEAHGLGWMAWAWDDPIPQPDNHWFALSHSGFYNSSADLTDFGKVVVEDATSGLLKVARPATIFK